MSDPEGTNGQLLANALSRAELAERERDNARAECTWLAKRLLKYRVEISIAAGATEDEGGRVYFGHTAHADMLKEVAEAMDDYDMDRIVRESKWPDYIETSRAAHEREAAEKARADAAEARVKELEADVKQLSDALDYLAPALLVLRNMCGTAGLTRGEAKAKEMIEYLRGLLNFEPLERAALNPERPK